MTAFRNDDLVLRVATDFDPTLVRLSLYEGFLDALCGDREYQKDAIRSACRFLAGGEYQSTRSLAEANYAANPVLIERYGSLSGLVDALPFPDRLACSLDLATATGKSWVLYGIARILLAENVVDRVLVLCPSLTIESGLTAKFKRLSADATLLDHIPDDAECRTPEIVDANVTTGLGDICIENIAATYSHVRSSVHDSFAGKGDRTLVLNDEAHHIYSPPTGMQAIKKWKSFLEDETYRFTRIVGVSGTCYVGNDYFADVIYRYSLRTAMEEGQVKQVEYVAKDENLGQDERFQKYLEMHKQNATRYPGLKPLSILVTARIAGAEDVAREFVNFLAKEESISTAEAESRVLVVSSKADHKGNVARLATVDRPDDKVQWIFSVSMLTEGWDVQNVFQIIPHEKRAFASKLLIAQVLGRGLRVPHGLSRPVVRVFNHSSWSSEIANLVDEILEQDRRLHSYPVTEGAHAQHHFELHQLSYETETKEQDLPLKNGDGQVNLFTRGYVNFETQPVDLERSTVFMDALTHRESVHKTNVHFDAYTVDGVVRRLRARLKSIDLEGDTTYSTDYPPALLRAVVSESLTRINEHRGLVSETNLQHLFRAMGNVSRPLAKSVRIQLKPMEMQSISTAAMPRRSAALTSFSKEATVFYDSESVALSEDADQSALGELTDDESTFPKRATRHVTNKFYFKSPVNVVLSTHEPERSFIIRLFEDDVSDKLDSWVKSPDTGFYEIGYSWRKGDHTKQGKFNPDLFIKLAGGKDVLVIELKDDGDDSDENKAKFKFAREHFDRINTRQPDVRYHMKFMSPGSYDLFFNAVKNVTATKFVSALQAALTD